MAHETSPIFLVMVRVKKLFDLLPVEGIPIIISLELFVSRTIMLGFLCAVLNHWRLLFVSFLDPIAYFVVQSMIMAICIFWIPFVMSLVGMILSLSWESTKSSFFWSVLRRRICM